MSKIGFLIAILVISLILGVIAVLIISKKPKKSTKSVKKVDEDILDFEDLVAVLKNGETSSEKLLDTLKTFNENFTIDEDNAQKYLVFLSRVLTHKNKNKDIFNYFHKEVKGKNLKFKKELESIEMKALN